MRKFLLTILALSAAALYAVRWARRTRAAVTAGLLLGAAFLTKQSALAEAVAVLGVLAAGPRRKLAVTAALRKRPPTRG